MFSTTRKSGLFVLAIAASLIAAPAFAGKPVRSVNYAPVITGTPVVAAQARQPYAFLPSATDANGDKLTFSIVNKPVWATFDATNGMLYGTPSDANVGTYPNVTIKVSDGKVTSSLPAFTITVAAAPTQSVTLSWTAPSQNTDGSSLTDLAGYKVVYGNTSGQYTQTLSLTSAAMNSVVLEGLQAGTWYFAVKAVNTAGVESNLSAEVSKVL